MLHIRFWLASRVQSKDLGYGNRWMGFIEGKDREGGETERGDVL